MEQRYRRTAFVAAVVRRAALLRCARLTLHTFFVCTSSRNGSTVQRRAMFQQRPRICTSCAREVSCECWEGLRAVSKRTRQMDRYGCCAPIIRKTGFCGLGAFAGPADAPPAVAPFASGSAMLCVGCEGDAPETKLSESLRASANRAALSQNGICLTIARFRVAEPRPTWTVQ